VTGRIRPLAEDSRRVFITIDDGPSELTGRILDILDEIDIHATWFVTGINVSKRPVQIREIVDAGHSIGNHSFAHLDSWCHPRKAIEDDLDKGLREIEKVTGATSTLTRPPFGRLRPSILTWARERDQSIVLWDVMVDDFRTEVDPDGVSGSVSRYARDGSIIVFHDHGLPEQVQAIRRSLQQLRNEGWSFGRLRI
jgi:peptidoglycan/xylan/chitin deacetylase (PgdA/CDA1 family)